MKINEKKIENNVDKKSLLMMFYVIAADVAMHDEYTC